MEKLKSPLTEQEYKKINTFFTANKHFLKRPNDQRDLHEFIDKNGLFSDMVSELGKADTILAWMHLKKLVIQPDVQKTTKKIDTREVLGGIIAIVLIIGISIILYTCVTSFSDKPKVKKDYEYMTDCQKMIESKIRYPSSVDHYGIDTLVNRAPNGNVVVIAPFSAKNTFGMEIEHRAMCIFSQDGKGEISMTD